MEIKYHRRKIMKIEPKAKTKHINFFVDASLRNKIDKIKQDYVLSDVLRKLLNEFHDDNYEK